MQVFESVSGSERNAQIRVIGIGGAGSNAINNMIQSKLQGVRFIAANTDAQMLDISKAPIKIQLGAHLTEGLGAGTNPEAGREAAKENTDEIRSVLEDSRMVFITAGLGGGTGTGAAPVVAEISKELGALTVAVVTKPFAFEGKRRMEQAVEGIERLSEIVDTLIVIPNDRLLGLASKNATLVEMFRRADEVLLHSVKGITDLIMNPGLVNLDFADINTILSKAGMAFVGTGMGNGEKRAVEAAEKAISHPLLENVSISGASGILMNITCGSDLTMAEMTEASDRIYKEAGEDAEIIWGTVLDDSIRDELRVTVIAAGVDEIQLDNLVSPQTAGAEELNKAQESEIMSLVSPMDEMPESREDIVTVSPRKIAIEESDVWKMGYSLFYLTSDNPKESQKIKEYRDEILKASTKTCDEMAYNFSVSFLNSLWLLSKDLDSVPTYSTNIIRLMDYVIQGEIRTSLYYYYSFIVYACHIDSADDIVTMPTTLLDNIPFYNNTILQVVKIPYQIDCIKEIIKRESSESSTESLRKRLKKIAARLHELTPSLQSERQSPEVLCLRFVICKWIQLIEKALRISFGKLKYRLISPSVIYMGKWNEVKLEISGGPPEESFEISAPFTQDYDLELLHRRGTFHNSSVVIELRVRPNNQGTVNLLLGLEGIICQIEILALPLNPFIVGTPVQSDEMFFGRRDLVNRIIRGLLAPNPINFLVTGRRRIGKTSLLYAIKRRLPPGILPVLISMEMSGRNLANIYQTLANEIIHSINEMNLLNNYEDSLSIIITDNDPNATFISWLRRVHEKMRKTSIHRIVLLIDEALAITEWDEQAQALLRYLLSNMHWIQGILAGPPDVLERITEHVSSPLYNIFKIEKIGPLNEEDAIELIVTSLKRYGIENLDQIAKRVYSYTGGVPFYIQAIGYELIENWLVDKIQGEELLENSLSQIRDKYHTSYPVILNKLSPEQKIAIVSIVRGIAPPEVCGQRLAEADLVEKVGDRWMVRAKLEREWVRIYADKLLDSAGKALWDRYGKNIDLPRLAEDLKRLQRELQESDEDLLLATEAAKAGNGGRALTYLIRSGQWVLDTATKIGTDVAVAAIKMACGLQ